MSDQAENQDLALRRFRDYLSALAQVQVDPRLRGKLDLSGVVQQTLLEAHQAWGQLRGWNEQQQAGWLRRSLANNLTDAVRGLRTGGRDVLRERSLEAALDESSARLEAFLVARESSPSQQADRREQAFRVAAALARLPDPQRDALVLQQWHGWTLAQIAEHLGVTSGVVAGLLHRGMQNVEKHLREEG